MTDDQSFHAPAYQKPTPRSIQAAGVRLYAYAVSHGYPKDQPILEMPIADDVEEADELRKAQRLCRWFLSIQ